MKFKLFSLFFLVALFSCSAIFADENKNSRNLTPEYKSLDENSPLTTEEKKILQKHKILLILGFLSNSIMNASDYFKGFDFKVGDYFEDQVAFLKENGCESGVVGIESEETPLFNSKLIIKAIKESTKPVIFVSHSKGGVDILVALLKLRNDDPDTLLSKVKGWISIQSAFKGSPIADLVLGSIFADDIKWLLEELGGSEKVLESLSVDKRKIYLKVNRVEIASIVKMVPLISFASWKEDVGLEIDTLLEPSRDLMSVLGYDSDGVVDVESQILPGSDFVKIEGVDHIASVMSYGLIDFDRKSSLQKLLKLLLKKIQN